VERGTKGSKRETARGTKRNWERLKETAPCIYANYNVYAKE
jgi:hypothetical protein